MRTVALHCCRIGRFSPLNRLRTAQEPVYWKAMNIDQKLRQGETMPAIYVVFGTLLLLLFAYSKIVRPRQLTWGATAAEAAETRIGDEIVQHPHFVATRAVTIAAPPAEVWKWILQIGSARAGWYSLDLLDNGNVPSSWDILPEFQKIEIGGFIPFTPDQKNGMWVKEYREFDYILWWDQKGAGTWGWYLEATADGGARLITRLRTRYTLSFPWLLYYLVYDFGDIVMMRKCLQGIKARAERAVMPVIADEAAPAHS